jgi:hypothetical protein
MSLSFLHAVVKASQIKATQVRLNNSCFIILRFKGEPTTLLPQGAGDSSSSFFIIVVVVTGTETVIGK